ncbi:MAG TPA: hypothetical protein VJ814_02625 [Gaiellaceae bacterium]|nr:hypothetical protein [Gaiellaceae bacterium]
MTHEYDTAGRDLERAGLTLSRHPSEAGVDWRLRLRPGEQVEAWEPGTSGLSPPAEIVRLIEAITAGKELVPLWPRDRAGDEYALFEDLARRLLSVREARLPWRAGSGAA